jgi:UrcA family protein
MLRKVAISLATMTALLTVAHADSQIGTIRRDVEVFYRPADLSSEAGARTLLVRINAAARKACGGAPFFDTNYDIAPGLAQKDFAKCQVNAVSTAVSRLNAPLLNEVYARTGEAEALRLAGR